MAEATSSFTSLKSNKLEEQNLIVALRIRPMNEDEIIQGATPIAHCVDDKMVVLMDPMEDPDDILRANRTRERQFMFDVAFDGSSSQKEVYEKTTKALIPSVVNGFNATVFAYGATGAGKTHTMLGTDSNPGIMAHALNDLFLEMERSQDSMKYSVRLSYLEIYNEMIRDLLQPESGYLDLREDAKGVQVAGLSEVNAKCTREVMEILVRGNRERTQEPTAANQASSRSHAVLQIAVQQQSRVRDITQQVRVGKFFLVDLAGSERAANTQNRGKRMVEGAHINRSLLALGNCINALSCADKNKLQKYINYRDSKLTRLLKDSLGGNCKTVMIAHVSPASIFFEESRNTLVYADRAKHIKTKVRRNVADVTYHLAQYNHIIQDLKEEIKRLHRRLEKQASSHHSIHTVHSEVMQESKKGELADLARLKRQLMKVFDSQTALRQSLMELNSTGMDINLDIYRNQMVIQKWERDKDLAAGRKMHIKDKDKLKAEEKRLELHGGSTDELSDPEEVTNAREQLQSLLSEREMAEKVKEDLQKQVKETSQKATQLEEAFPKNMQNEEQREILSLLCKVQELQVENMDMQSSCVLRNFEIAKRDMAVDMYEGHKDLCREIILQQRALMEENNICGPKELDDLYELYQHEYSNFSLPDINAHKMGLTASGMLDNSSSDMGRSSSVAPSGVIFPKLFTPVRRTDSRTRRQVLQNASYNLAKYGEQKKDDDKIFSPSPIAQHLQKNSTSSINKVSPNEQVPRQKSIVTLSTHSNGSSPIPKEEPDTDRNVIATNTRNIAMLAAMRRTSRAQHNNGADRLDMDDPVLNAMSVNADRDSALRNLTQSRLALHDKSYGSNLTLTNLTNDEQRSVYTDNQIRKNSERRRVNNQLRVVGGKDSKKPYRSLEQAKYQQMTPEEFFHQLARAGVRRQADVASSVDGGRPARRSRYPAHARHASHPPSKVKATVNKTQPLFNEEANEFHPSAPALTVSQSTSDKNKINQRKQKGGEIIGANSIKVGPVNHSELNSKKNPSIPGYRNGDISITGFGIQ